MWYLTFDLMTCWWFHQSHPDNRQCHWQLSLLFCNYTPFFFKYFCCPYTHFLHIKIENVYSFQNPTKNVYFYQSDSFVWGFTFYMFYNCSSLVSTYYVGTTNHYFVPKLRCQYFLWCHSCFIWSISTLKTMSCTIVKKAVLWNISFINSDLLSSK